MKKHVERVKRHQSGRTIADIPDHTSPLPLPSALAAIAAGRDHITTEEYARATSRSPQTIRKNACLTGRCFGVTPLKCGNRLLWPVVQIAALLNGRTPSEAGIVFSESRAGVQDGNAGADRFVAGQRATGRGGA